MSLMKKIAKAMTVAEEFKKLPFAERKWLLDECKKTVYQHLSWYRSALAETTDSTAKTVLDQRVKTLELAQRLLGTILLRE